MHLVWLRQNLRLKDNPALVEATVKKCVAVYIVDPAAIPKDKTASMVYLYHSLKKFAAEWQALGGQLYFLKGPVVPTLVELVSRNPEIQALFTERSYTPGGRKKEEALRVELSIPLQIFEGNVLLPPTTVKTKGEGKPYKVYTPFWRAVHPILAKRGSEGNAKTVKEVTSFSLKHIERLPLDALGLLPERGWKNQIEAFWRFGESEAWSRLKNFEPGEYEDQRDFPAIEGTSKISPSLHFGEIGVRDLYAHLLAQTDSRKTLIFRKEIVWREFAYYLLYHFPHTCQEPLYPKYKNFRWDNDTQKLKAWQRGETGYPLVDAGMRQLYQCGWMHNRVRMVVASFLVKDLLIDWRLGAKWFMETLVDADLASNTLGWQWAAGCGADAAPFFRIFNPLTQSQKFDPKGDYIRQYVPELQQLNDSEIHAPYLLDPSVLEQKQIRLDKDYPSPIVNHQAAREEALTRYKEIK